MPASKKTIRPYQRTGIDWLKQPGRFGKYLGDEQGLGKSAQIILYMEETGIDRGLIVCPAFLRATWAREFRTWAGRDVNIIETGTSEIRPDGINVVSYHQAALGSHERLRNHRWPVMIFDEAHALTNPAALMTRKIMGGRNQRGLLSTARQILPMSGTPIPNRVTGMYTWLKRLIPDEMQRYSFQGFASRFGVEIDTVTGAVRGYRNSTEFHALTRAVFLRRLKRDVLPELPPKTFMTIDIDATGELKRILTQESFEYRHNVRTFRQLARFAKMRHKTAKLKVSQLTPLIEDDIDRRGKLLIVGFHTSMLNDLAHALARFDPITIHGRVPPGNRADMVERFKNETRHRVLIGQQQAIGGGLTIAPATDRCWYVEPWYAPGPVDQAVDRLHRHGTISPVTIMTPLFTIDGVESVDHRIYATSHSRRQGIHEFINQC